MAFHANAKDVTDCINVDNQSVIVKNLYEIIDFHLVDANSPLVDVFLDFPSNKPMCHYYVEVEIYQNGVLVGLHVYEGTDYCETMAALMSAIIDRYL